MNHSKSRELYDHAMKTGGEKPTHHKTRALTTRTDIGGTMKIKSHIKAALGGLGGIALASPFVPNNRR